jgi:hypothetical protein
MLSYLYGSFLYIFHSIMQRKFLIVLVLDSVWSVRTLVRSVNL